VRAGGERTVVNGGVTALILHPPGFADPSVDLAATALDTLRDVNIEDLERFAYDPAQAPAESETPRSPFSSGSRGSGARGDNVRRNS
jgi:hypothetical protein